MACTPLPDIPLPSLPGGITLTPPDPGVSFDPALCCKLLPFPVATPPIALPVGTLSPAVIATLLETLQGIQDYLDGLPLRCPRE